MSRHFSPHLLRAGDGRVWFSALCCLAALVALPACGRGRYHDTMVRAGSTEVTWADVTIPGTGTTAYMPGQPRYAFEHGMEDDGAASEGVTATVPYAGAMLGAIVFTTEPAQLGNAYRSLELLRAEFGEREGRTEQQFDYIEEQGFPGFYARWDDPEKHATLYARFFVGVRRFYGFLAFVPRGMEERLGPTIDGYLLSGRPDPTDAFTAQGDGRIDLTRWHWTYPPGMGFAAEFPGTPMNTPESARAPMEGQLRYRRFEVRDDSGAVFEVRSTGFREEAPEDALAQLEASPPEGFRVRQARDTAHRGFPARSLVYESDSALRFQLHIRRGNRVYEVIATLPRTSGRPLLDARSRFFRAFRVN